MEMTIRNVAYEDLDQVALIEEDCFPEKEAASKETLGKRIKAFSECFFVAEAEGEIIGFVNGAVTNDPVIHDEMFDDETLHNPTGAYQAIFGLDVMPGYQRQGIAAKLMDHMIATAEKAGRKGVILTCKEHLVNYYSRFGFRNMGISASTHGGAVWYDMILEF